MNLNDQVRNTTYLSLQRLSGRMILQPVLKVSVSDASVYSFSMSIGPTWCGGNLGLKLRLRAPKSGWTSSSEKSTSMLIRRSSALVTPLEAHLFAAGLHHEEAPLEIVRDSEEMLAVSIECRLLDRVSIGILPMGLKSFPLQSKWLHKTRAACSQTKMVSLLEESSPWDVA